MKNKLKVYVGLSGGVDSAVSAALLKKEGYEVTGVFIKGWSPEGYPCTWREDRRSAMRAAAVLDIPFITLNLEKEYKREVANYMILEYKRGKTPNPDVMCNKEIKFGHFLKFALKNGANFIATGHYARTFPSPGQGEDRVGLMEGSDKSKDQSYFLWILTREQLKHVLFPVGHLQKREVRGLAKKFCLPQATRKDSQGLCFLGQIEMKEFLKEFAGAEKGKVLDERGRAIGEHDGALLYTMGERHGFTVINKTGENVPLYVVAKDIEENTITVAPLQNDVKQTWRSPRILKRKVVLKDVNLIGKAKNNKNLLCRIRYRQEKIKGKIGRNKDKKIIFRFDKWQGAVSPGQSLVFYDGEVCLGGGVIE